MPFSGIGRRYIIEFNATSSSHTIKFTNWGHICSTCTELILDDVRLYTVHELPETVAQCTLITGINDAPDYMTTILPNPLTNKLEIKTNNNKFSEVILYDITSRKILSKGFTNFVSLNTEQLISGIYIYEIRNKNGVIKKGKVVKG